MNSSESGVPTMLPSAIAIVALILASFALFGPSRDREAGPGTAQVGGLVESIDSDGVIKAGYGVFPPYSMEDPNTGEVSGVSVDIVNEIGRQMGLEVEWYRFNWNTMNADLQRGQFDILADAVFQTPARGREMSFTDPYAFFAIGIGVVRRGENRYADFNEINDPDTIISVGKGFAEETFVLSRAPKAQIMSVDSSQDTAAPINAVLTGRADIAIVNLDDAKRFVSANPDDLEIRWEDNPPAFVPAGFALRYGDVNGVGFLNVSLRNLRSTGVLDRIASDYGVEAAFEDPR